jgi:hypothetical protein
LLRANRGSNVGRFGVLVHGRRVELMVPVVQQLRRNRRTGRWCRLGGATCFLTLSLTVFRPFFATCAREEVFLEVFVFLVDFFIGFVFFVIDFVFFVGGMRLAMAPLSGTRCKIVAVNDGWARIAPSSMRTVAPCFE